MDRKPLISPIFYRQDGESDVAWEAFKTYRDAGTARTLEATREALGKVAGYDRVLEEWSSTWSWVRRTVEWDRHLDNKRRAAQEAEVVKMAERQARDAMTVQAGLRPIFEALEKQSGRSLDELQDLSPMAWAVLIKEVMPAFKSAAELERLARGVETDHVHVSHGVIVDDLRSAYAERLRRRSQASPEGTDAPSHDATPPVVEPVPSSA